MSKKLTGKTRYRNDKKGRFILQAEYKHRHISLTGGHIDGVDKISWQDVDTEIYTMLNLTPPTKEKNDDTN